MRQGLERGTKIRIVSVSAAGKTGPVEDSRISGDLRHNLPIGHRFPYLLVRSGMSSIQRFRRISAAVFRKSSADCVNFGKSDSQMVDLGSGSVARRIIMCQCR